MNKTQYCNEHDRVRLKDGLCVACGEIEYKLPKKEATIIEQVRYLILMAIGGIIIFAIMSNLSN